MTVKELIEKLTSLSPDAPVLLAQEDDGATTYTPITQVSAEMYRWDKERNHHPGATQVVRHGNVLTETVVLSNK